MNKIFSSMFVDMPAPADTDSSKSVGFFWDSDSVPNEQHAKRGESEGLRRKIHTSAWNRYEVRNGTPFFGSEREGDQFSDEDIASWTEGGHFARVWRESGSRSDFYNDAHHFLTDEVAALNLPVMEIACGPNMGLIPHIVAKNKNIPCLATDACPQIITCWQAFLAENPVDADISFASFNAANMPIRSDSVDVITSSIGFGSMRYSGDDCELGLAEAFRVLKRGGHVFALEYEREDRALVDRAFELWGKQNWFSGDKLNWRERFLKAGFVVEYEKFHARRALRADDNELGEAAVRFGIEINLVSSAYKLIKP